MKLSNLIWVLALAGTVAACNSGLPIQGCEVDPNTGNCVGEGPGPGTGGANGGPTPCEVPPDASQFTNACACEAQGQSDINCDYGCSALGNIFGFAAILNVFPEEGFQGGGAHQVEFTGAFIVSEAFIEGAEAVLQIDLRTAVVPNPGTVPIRALSGATGPDLIMNMVTGVEIDLEADPDGNGVPGPFPLPVVPASETYTFDATGGEACFNFAQINAIPPDSGDIKFPLTVTSSSGGQLPAIFDCYPADQELINLTEVDCTSDDECPEGSSCDPDLEACSAIRVLEPPAGQVCLTIP